LLPLLLLLLLLLVLPPTAFPADAGSLLVLLCASLLFAIILQAVIKFRKPSTLEPMCRTRPADLSYEPEQAITTAWRHCCNCLAVQPD
jgi:hypothetical protein